MEAIRSQIASRALVAGEKLPSIRAFAGSMQVSPSTVVEAYDRLAAEGVIFARRGAGFYVSDVAQPFSVSKVEPKLDRNVDPFWVSRQSLDADSAFAKPGCGWLPADWMPVAPLRRALRGLARGDDALLSDYGDTRGFSDLRRLLARQFADEGLPADTDQILLTSCGTQAIDLICRLLLKPGDAVLVDDPCYFNFQAILRAHQVAAVGVPMTHSGPDMPQFERTVAQVKPRLYLTNSALHNPTGAALTPQIAHRILKVAATHGLIIVEDDIFSAFEPDPSPRLASLDGLNQVIRIGSFSKTLSASVRCGYIAARPDWVEVLIDLQIATNFGGPSPLAAHIVFAALSDGSYRKHLEALRIRLARSRLQVSEKLGLLGIAPWLMPRGGFYLWCLLPEGVSAAGFAQRALTNKIVLAPGNVFSVSQGMDRFMRFNVSQMSDDAIYETLRRTMLEV
ncbi:PLP-dependent aminotransferase family protein [Labrenzia sp. PHM005]|nr:PLP-dependent aminotransferase family protein [Labrenzia sp. PHM005]